MSLPRSAKRGDAGGIALLSFGFRPFFLLAGLCAVLALPAWLAMLQGRLALPTAFDPVLWHGHAMLFGFVQAAIAGFLLTAVPNWTGRLPVRGRGLGALALLFLAGRLAVATSAAIGPLAAAAIDLAFPLALLAVLAREIVAGASWRNLPVLAALAAFAAANALTHAEAIGWSDSGQLGLRLGIAVPALLIGLIGGRIVPSFTRNWLAKRGARHLPAAAGRFDDAAQAVTAIALAVWAVAPDGTATAPLLAIAALANLLRLARWQGHRTLAEPLVAVLHLGFLWLPLGFALLAAAPFAAALPVSAAMHALTGGAIATMILAVSTRAILGHTGRALRAGTATTAIYGLAVVSAASRIAAGLPTGAEMALLSLSGVAWTAAFALFLGVYGPMLLRSGRQTPARAP